MFIREISRKSPDCTVVLFLADHKKRVQEVCVRLRQHHRPTNRRSKQPASSRLMLRQQSYLILVHLYLTDYYYMNRRGILGI